MTYDEAIQQAVIAERERIIALLNGIDKTETEYDSGWWETSVGAEFGAQILEKIRSGE